MDTPKTKRGVQFALKNDVFILPLVEEEERLPDIPDDLTVGVSRLDLEGTESSIDGASLGKDGTDECKFEDGGGSAKEGSFGLQERQSRLREAIYYWTSTPYGQLIEDSVEEEGEAKDVQKYITSFVRIEENDDCPRGLERQVCVKHNETRKALIENATHAVLLSDFRLRYEEKNLSEDEIWKTLREVSKKQSRGAHAFARKMGKADEAAVKRGAMETKSILEQIEEVKERRKNGSKAVRRSSPEKTSSKDDEKRTSTSSSSSSRDKTDKSPDKDRKLDKKERMTSLRIASMSLKRNSLVSSKDKKDKDKKEKDKELDSVDLPLIHDIDKRGKTKTASRWKSIKKRLSASSHGKRSQ